MFVKKILENETNISVYHSKKKKKQIFQFCYTKRRVITFNHLQSNVHIVAEESEKNPTWAVSDTCPTSAFHISKIPSNIRHQPPVQLKVKVAK